MESMDQFIGTKAVSERHAFDVGALERHLQRDLPGFAGPLSVEQFKGGQSNPTYKLITPQRMQCAASPDRWPNCCRRRTRSSASSAS
jgi:hypothetical protein